MTSYGLKAQCILTSFSLFHSMYVMIQLLLHRRIDFVSSAALLPLKSHTTTAVLSVLYMTALIVSHKGTVTMFLLVISFKTQLALLNKCTDLITQLCMRLVCYLLCLRFIMTLIYLILSFYNLWIQFGIFQKVLWLNLRINLISAFHTGGEQLSLFLRTDRTTIY